MKNSQLRHLAALAGVPFTEGTTLNESADKPSKKKLHHQVPLERAIKSTTQAESDVHVVFRGTSVEDGYEKMFKKLLDKIAADLDDINNRKY